MVETILEALATLVGAGNVSNDPERLAVYATDLSTAPRRTPSFVVRPQNPAQICELVLWANRTRTPLVAVSSGGPHFLGDTVPAQPETVIVDLTGMNRILRIDRRNKIAVIEPGVTYAQLDAALAAEGLRVVHPLKPRANKSVVASLLERQPTIIPRFNYSLPEPLRNCGVVWGSGEISFTGEAGSGPLDLEEQWKRRGSQVDPKGPLATDLMRLLTGAQGTMGIVVWASVKCELIPAAHRFLFAAAETLEGLIDLCYRAQRIRMGDELMLLNGAELASLVGRDGAEVEKLRAALPAWVLLFGLAGAGYYPEQRVEVQELDLRRMAQKAGVEILRALPGLEPAALRTLFDVSAAGRSFKLTAAGACRELFFLTTLDKAPAYVASVLAIAQKHRYPASSIGIYIQPQHHGVSQHVEFTLPFDDSDKAAAAAAERVVEEASEELIKGGAYFSRPYGDWARMVYGRDQTASRVLKVVKQIVDPNNILNPGKLCF